MKHSAEMEKEKPRKSLSPKRYGSTTQTPETREHQLTSHATGRPSTAKGGHEQDRDLRKKGATQKIERRREKGGERSLRHTERKVIVVVLFVGFEHGSPAVVRSIRNWSLLLLGSSKLLELRTFGIEFINIDLRWLPTNSPIWEITIAQVLLQGCFCNIVGRLLK